MALDPPLSSVAEYVIICFPLRLCMKPYVARLFISSWVVADVMRWFLGEHLMSHINARVPDDIRDVVYEPESFHGPSMHPRRLRRRRVPHG